MMRCGSRIGCLVCLAGALLLHASVSNATPNRLAFATCSSRRPALQTRSCQFLGNQFRVVPKKPMIHKRSKTTTLSMFMGTDGGILGVGTPEVFTVLLVGYFVLGPSDLYKIVKEIGKFIQNFRTLGADLTKTVENNFESQLQLEEIRKAQRELNDAFSFRRTINTDEDIDAFTSTAKPQETVATEASAATATAAGAATATTAKKKKKVRRRRVKKQPVEEAPPEVPAPSDFGQIEDLDMTSAFEDSPPPVSKEDAAVLGQEGLQSDAEQSSSPDWFNMEGETAAAEATSSAAEQDRFASQLSESWNQQILANEDKLSPLSKVMERLAILEEEKNAANERLEEEFRLRAQLAEKYYRKRRAILEEAAAEVQAEAYVGMDNKNEKGNTDALQTQGED